MPLYWYASDPWAEWNDTVVRYAASHAVVVPNGNHRRFLQPAQANEEEKLHATARRLLRANSSTSVLFYLNSMVDWEQYDLHAAILARTQPDRRFHQRACLAECMERIPIQQHCLQTTRG